MWFRISIDITRALRARGVSRYCEVLVLESKHVQQVLRKDPDTDVRRLFKHLKAMEFANAHAHEDASREIVLDAGYVKACGRRFRVLYGLERYVEAVGDAELALKLEPSSQRSSCSRRRWSSRNRRKNY